MGRESQRRRACVSKLLTCSGERDQQARSYEIGTETHPETVAALIAWYKVAKKSGWRGLHQVRLDFPSADQVGEVLIFDILGNRYRLITRVKYNIQRIYTKAVLNHSEYDRKEWMKWV